jgi:hypothetical protein
MCVAFEFSKSAMVPSSMPRSSMARSHSAGPKRHYSFASRVLVYMMEDWEREKGHRQRAGSMISSAI